MILISFRCRCLNCHTNKYTSINTLFTRWIVRLPVRVCYSIFRTISSSIFHRPIVVHLVDAFLLLHFHFTSRILLYFAHFLPFLLLHFLLFNSTNCTNFHTYLKCYLLARSVVVVVFGIIFHLSGSFLNAHALWTIINHILSPQIYAFICNLF